MTASAEIRFGGVPADLRRINRQTALRILHGGGIYTIADLARISGLSRPTTGQAVADLVASGWIAPSESDTDGPPVMGRPAKRFQFRPAAAHVLGADVGAHKVMVLIADLHGTEIARARRQVAPDWPAARRLGSLGDAIEEALSICGKSPHAITNAAIATVGSVDPSGTVIYCKAMPEWEGSNPGEWVCRRFGFETSGASDMVMAALAEHWRGAAQNARDIVYLHAGLRLGAGLLINGRPHVGHHSAATQIGMWKGLAWKPQYDALLHLPQTSIEDTGLDGRRLFEAAIKGDAEAAKRVEELVSDMCQGLAPIIITVDPEMLVIGGGLSGAGEAVAAPLRRRISQETAFPPKVVCSTLGDEAVALGAVRQALDQAEHRLFGGVAFK